MTVDAINPGTVEVPEGAQEMIRSAVEQAKGQLQPMMAGAKADSSRRIERWLQQANAWEAEKAAGSAHSVRAAKTSRLLEQEKALVASLHPDRELVRPLVLVLPREA